MVMRARVVVTVTQELDRQWRIRSETAIKAKSVRGYSTYNRKGGKRLRALQWSLTAGCCSGS